MKIAMIAGPYLPVPPQKYGGTERVIAHIIKGLMEEDHQVTLLASGDSEIDCELVPICDKHLFFGKTLEEQKRKEKQVEKIFKKMYQWIDEHGNEYDVIHSHGFDLAEYDRSPHVTTLHGKFTLEQMGYYEAREHVPYVSISQNQRNSFPNLNYVGTAYNGLDPAEFPINHKPEDYVCFIGRFDREKNPHLALQLAIKFGIKIKIAGKIDFLGNGYIEDEVQPLLDHPLVEYLGEIGMEEKVKLLRGSKCNLHPTGFREPFGLTVLEAAYCGTPTLAISNGSMPEVIEDHKTGVLVEDFAEGYHYLDECFAMDRGYIASRARETFNYHNMTQQYLQAYENAIGQFRLKQAAKEIKPSENRGNLFKPSIINAGLAGI